MLVYSRNVRFTYHIGIYALAALLIGLIVLMKLAIEKRSSQSKKSIKTALVAILLMGLFISCVSTICDWIKKPVYPEVISDESIPRYQAGAARF